MIFNKNLKTFEGRVNAFSDASDVKYQWRKKFKDDFETFRLRRLNDGKERLRAIGKTKCFVLNKFEFGYLGAKENI